MTMKANKNPTTITASVTVYATFDRSDVQDWFNAKVKERADDPTDLWSLMWRYDEFLSSWVMMTPYKPTSTTGARSMTPTLTMRSI